MKDHHASTPQGARRGDLPAPLPLMLLNATDSRPEVDCKHRIDIVYLWVDGTDRQWQAKRSRPFLDWKARQPCELAVYGNVAGRYRDNGELRFSLRTLGKFFPDHGEAGAMVRPAAGRSDGGRV
jgi:Stealth protein CR1, conserved region 1